MKVVILGSGKGTNTHVLIDAFKQNQLGEAKIVAVFSDVLESGVLKIAEENQIPKFFLEAGSVKHRICEDHEKNWIESIQQHKPDLIILAGFMRVLGKSFLSAFKNRIINLHPSLLPSFKGLNAVKRAFEYKVKITGCTIHWVNEDIDGGDIIAQAPVRIMDGDTFENVMAKVQAAEHMLLPWIVSDLSTGTLPLPD